MYDEIRLFCWWFWSSNFRFLSTENQNIFISMLHRVQMISMFTSGVFQRLMRQRMSNQLNINLHILVQVFSFENDQAKESSFIRSLCLECTYDLTWSSIRCKSSSIFIWFAYDCFKWCRKTHQSIELKHFKWISVLTILNLDMDTVFNSKYKSKSKSFKWTSTNVLDWRLSQCCLRLR